MDIHSVTILLLAIYILIDKWDEMKKKDRNDD